jgi:hypothetical protein
MLSGDNISSSATDGGGGGTKRAGSEPGPGARGPGRRTEAHLRREQLGGDRDAGLLRLSRGDSFHHQFRFREDVHRRSSFLRVGVGAGEAGERGFSSSRGGVVERGSTLSRASVHSVPQPRFSVNRTPVRRANQTSKNIAKSFISVYRRAATGVSGARDALDRGDAQTAKGTPLCKHRDMPSETLVRNSSHSSPRRGGARSNPGYVACGRKRAERRASASNGAGGPTRSESRRVPLSRRRRQRRHPRPTLLPTPRDGARRPRVYRR